MRFLLDFDKFAPEAKGTKSSAELADLFVEKEDSEPLSVEKKGAIPQAGGQNFSFLLREQGLTCSYGHFLPDYNLKGTRTHKGQTGEKLVSPDEVY